MTTRPRHRSTRPADEPAVISSTGMDFEKRRMVIPHWTIVRLYSDQMRQTEKTASFTAGDETVILADATGGEIKIALPTASDIPGKWYWIKKIDSSGNAVIIDADGAETIDGEQTLDLGLQYQYVVIISDGTEWFILGGEYVKMEEILREQQTLLGQLAKQLGAILRCLSSMSGLNIKEEDIT